MTGSSRTLIVKKNILYSLALKGISVAISIAYVPVLLEYLDTETYGVWLTIATITQWIGFFDLGIGQGLRNRLAEAIALDDKISAKELVSTTYALVIIIFSILAVLFTMVVQLLPWQNILNTQMLSNEELTFTITVMSVLLCFNFILNVLKYILFAQQKSAYSNSLDPISQLIAFAIIFYLVSTNQQSSLLLLSFILTGRLVFVLLLASIIFYNSDRNKHLRPSWNYVDFKRSKDLLSLGLTFFFIQISGLLIYASSNFIIIQVIGPKFVTDYQVVYKLFFVPIMLYGVFATPLWSSVTDAFTLGDFRWLSNTLKKLNKISVFIVGMTIVLAIFSEQVLNIWVGGKIKIDSYSIIAFAVYTIITLILTPYTQFINGFGKLRASLVLVIVQTIIYLPLAIYLTFSLDSVLGIIISQILVQLSSLILEYYQVNKILNKTAIGIWND